MFSGRCDDGGGYKALARGAAAGEAAATQRLMDKRRPPRNETFHPPELLTCDACGRRAWAWPGDECSVPAADDEGESVRCEQGGFMRGPPAENPFE